MRFSILRRDPHTMARSGLLSTAHGEVATPAFLPVGTRGAVKSMAPWEIAEIGFEMVLANTYHLFLRPGVEVVERAGGVQRFTGWERPVLTDSGGFQVFSLSSTVRVEEGGVRFRSVYDGSEHFLSPEEVVRIQERLGSDVAMILDHCVGYPCPRDEAKRAVETTLRWAEASLSARLREDVALFGIVQGGSHVELRKLSARLTGAMGFDGYGIGGLSVGEPREEMLRCLEAQTELLPEERPRHLLGIGDPEGIVQAVALGVDLFDCVLPTRMARTGVALTRRGRVNLRNARFREDLRPLEEGCGCPACRRFTRAYIRHLHQVNEMLAHRLLTWHNLAFMARLMLDCRAAIEAGRMLELIREWEGWDRKASHA